MAIGCVFIPLILVLLTVGAFFYIRASAAAQITVPEREVVLARVAPNTSAPLMARFGEKQTVAVTGRTEDWRWLEVDLWDGQHGWILRPLEIWIWQIEAQPTTPVAPSSIPVVPTPVAEEMIAIPATTFTMGSPPNQGEADERPAHPVSLSAFEIDRTEVTMGQYW
ncbi:MAG: SUMF1/EgtB/PvdO family nonheme iron enzyme, partial [Chloroflexi bacterium]|nr:SUMF1/EgtB/PvdO family nonheme iron enzyme [Chloroflexota bacterium]